MPSPIYFREFAGYPKEDRTLKAFTAVRKLLVPWDDRYALYESLISHPGQLYPYRLFSTARVVAVAIEPLGVQGQVQGWPDAATYNWAVVTAKYATPSFEDPQPYPEILSPTLHRNPQAVISETLEPSVEALRLDYEKFEWVTVQAPFSQALTPAEAPVRTVYRCMYTLTRHNLAEVPRECIDYVGKINNSKVTPILLETLWFPMHTIMFVPPTISLSADDEGTIRYDVTMRFHYKEEGWRQFWRSDIKAYDQITVIGGDLYAEPGEADFSLLFPS